jgi:NADH-quinone oxidoreductase subunit F
MSNQKMQILVCAGGGCVASGSLKVSAALKDIVKAEGLGKRVEIKETGCQGPCAVGPVCRIMPENVFYQNVQVEDAKDIIEQHVKKGVLVDRLIRVDDITQKKQPKVDDIPFFKGQTKVVLKNCGSIDPTDIDDYIAADGYKALEKVIQSMEQQTIIDEVKASGLRGRGGAGFLSGLKWEFTLKAEGDQKYVLCNADEGDPGAFMDRSILEGDPHAVIEGMAIAAFAVGADQGYVYCRAEYPLAVERLEIALKQARERGMLGKGIMGTDFAFDLELRMGSGAFVCGEETALITSIEGNRGEPRPRPPFPAQSGLWGKPTLLNNVETYANISTIILGGAEAYASVGTEKSKGTKIFALAGAVENSGLVEVPIGTPLGEIIYDIGGGIPDDKAFKAAQMGGPSGGCIPKQHLNVPVDYESLAELGAIMGSGGLIVMDDDSCMVDVARFFIEFVQEESCGKCVPCRIGTKRMLEILTRICEGQGKEGDVEILIKLGNQIKDTALCGLGQTAPNPVLSTIRHFREEYDAHIRDGKCEAGTCGELVRAPCQNACPAGVDIPGYVSLIGEKRYAEALRLHRERNPFVAVCARVCFHTCEDKCRRDSLDEKVAVRGLKRFMSEQEITVTLPAIKENAENAKKKIAIVGAGPAGLSCAYFLARLGYQPKVFEAEPRPGGMLVQTIPAYRLPREIVAREVRMIERMGVDIETNQRLGRDFTLSTLKKQGYDAVCLAVGMPEGYALKTPGADAEGVDDAIDFLREYNLRGNAPAGNDVVIVGGGNAAVDAARTALRLGAKNVTLVYRRTRAEMPAYAEEVKEAQLEGVKMEFLVNPSEFVVENGKVSAVKCQRMHLGEFDRSGRRRPEADAANEFILKADQVIMAVGQQLNTGEILNGVKIDLNESDYLGINSSTGQTSADWVFACGDAVFGPSSVAAAVGSGEIAAVGIDYWLTGETHSFWRDEKDVDTAFDPEAEPSMIGRAKMRLLPVARRVHNFEEVEMSFTEKVAVKEANRCLRCEYCAEK